MVSLGRNRNIGRLIINYVFFSLQDSTRALVKSSSPPDSGPNSSAESAAMASLSNSESGHPLASNLPTGPNMPPTNPVELQVTNLDQAINQREMKRLIMQIFK